MNPLCQFLDIKNFYIKVREIDFTGNWKLKEKLMGIERLAAALFKNGAKITSRSKNMLEFTMKDGSKHMRLFGPDGKLMSWSSERAGILTKGNKEILLDRTRTTVTRAPINNPLEYTYLKETTLTNKVNGQRKLCIEEGYPISKVTKNITIKDKVKVPEFSPVQPPVEPLSPFRLEQPALASENLSYVVAKPTKISVESPQNIFENQFLMYNPRKFNTSYTYQMPQYSEPVTTDSNNLVWTALGIAGTGGIIAKNINKL